MPACAAIGRDVSRWGIAALLLVLVGCLSPHEPEPADRVPPREPSLALLRARVPDALGVAWISGAAGCVEAGVTVLARDSGSANARTVRGQASSAGAFEIAFTAERLAAIEVVAIDAAGNASRAAVLAIGAPFELAPLCGDTPATAGDSLGIQASMRVMDESGAPVPGVDVRFLAGTLSPVGVTATTGDDGIAVWSTTTPTRAGEHALAASVAPALLASTVTCTLHVRPAAVSGLEVVSGSEQVGAPSGLLGDALACRAVDRFGNGVPDHTVIWTASAGSVSSPTSVTDANGAASVRWTFPAATGEWQVTATMAETAAVATFAGIAGGPPVIDTVTPDPATPGGEVVLTGGPFSRDAGYDEVWFESDGVDHAADVVDAAVDHLVVRVPDAATSGHVHVRVCGRAAVPAAVRVELLLGAVLDVPTAAPLRLETPSGDEEFIVGLFTDAEIQAPFQVGSVPAKPVANAPVAPTAGPDAFHAWLRQQEWHRRDAAPAPPAASPAKPMTQRTFTVLADLSGSSYATVTATLRYSGSAVHVYVDDRVPASDLSDAQVDALGGRFAGGAYGIVVNEFGATSNVDADGHVLVLLTPTVNQLTPPGSGAYVGGFFFAQDLHNVAHSNRAEVLYTMVPDPTGRWGNVFQVQNTLDVLDGVLPHELQHLVNYNQRVLLRHADPEDLWLNEALSHVAEGLCGEMQQNQLRANRFLSSPHLVSLTAGGNGLDERGMSFLFVRFLADQQDGAFLRRLVQTTRAGVDNVEHASGRSLDAWLRDWVAALYLDHAGLAQDPRFRYASLDLAGDFIAPQTQALSLEFPSAAGSLEPTGCRFYRLLGTGAAYTDLTVSGARAVVIRVR